MNNLQRWKAKRIKEIEDMSVEDVIECIKDDKCKWCINYGKDRRVCRMNGCKEEIKAYLEREVTNE